jgi:hypothetical protein
LKYNDQWVDVNPTVVPLPETYLDEITIDGSTINMNGSTLAINTAGVLLVNGEEVTGGGDTGLITFAGVKIIGNGDEGQTGAINLVPNDSLYSAGQWVAIYPTGAFDYPHVHIAAGTGGELYIGNDQQYIKTGIDGNIDISSYDGTNTNVWSFGTDGSITFPDSTVQTTAYTGGGGSAGPTGPQGDAGPTGPQGERAQEDRITTGSYSLIIDSEGVLTLPSGVQISNYSYQNNMFSLEADSVRAVNLYTNDRHGITVHGHASGQSTATTAVTITANAASTYDYQTWIFKADGTTEFPNRVKFTTSSFILPEAGKIVQPALVIGPVYDSQPDPTSGRIYVNKDTAPINRPYSSLDQYISPGTSMIASNGSSTSVISISSTGILDEYLNETYLIDVDATWLTDNYGTGAFTFDIYDGGTWIFGTDASLTFPDDTVQTTAFTATSYISKSVLKSLVAASTDFADFQTRIAAL